MVSKLLFKKTFKRRKRFNFSAMRAIKDMEGDSQKLTKVYKDEIANIAEMANSRLKGEDNLVQAMVINVDLGVNKVIATESAQLYKIPVLY
jgi:hypothetical protein